MSRLPGPYTALARQVAGEITDVTDCSWQRDSSAVWRLTSASGGCWYLKRHSSGRFHEREVAALRGWAQALGPGRVPELAAADPDLLVMVVTAVPGQPVLGSRLSADEEREVHRQAGLLLASLHESPVPPGADASRLISRVDRHLDQAGGLLTSTQRALARDCASRLTWLGRHVRAVASHGDFQPRNWLWDRASGALGVIDWERAEPAAAIRDLVRLEYGPWDHRPDLREAFLAGYGRARQVGTSDPRVLNAIRAVLRHAFVPGASLADAYNPDLAVITKRDTGGNALSCVSVPCLVGAVLGQLDVRDGHRMRIAKVRGHSVETVLVALDVLHHDARLVVVIGRQ